LIVNSNHHDHLDQWLNHYGDPKTDTTNAILYYRLMLEKLISIKNGKERGAFEIYMNDIYGVPENVRMMDSGFSLHGIQLSMHGHSGINGARGSAKSLSKIGEKSIIGHSHTPCWVAGCLQVGMMCRSDLDYLSGPSSWLHSNAIIHKNGKRQLVNIIKGRWRAKR
jgi:hypothetical protein